MKREDKAYWVLMYLLKNPEGLGPTQLGTLIGFDYNMASSSLTKTLEELVDGKFVEHFYRGGRGCYRLYIGDHLRLAKSFEVVLITKYERGKKFKYLSVVATIPQEYEGIKETFDFLPGRALEIVFEK